MVSPKITNAFEDVFKTLNWNGRGNDLNGEHISQLRFADDIVVMVDLRQEVQEMLYSLN